MYPLHRLDERKLPESFDGVVITCDVDKTYLDTDFESLTGLLTIPMEWAEDKQTVAGMAPVLRALRFGPGKQSAQTPFYFLTASPPFLMKELYRKMLMDGIQWDGITSKDWGTILLKRRKPAWLGRQVAFKLCALLHQRTYLPKNAREILIGDDAETDAVAYTLYADLVAGNIHGNELGTILTDEGCDTDERDEVMETYNDLDFRGEAVEYIYIYLVKGTGPAAFTRFGKDLIPCRSPFQIALHLALGGSIKSQAVIDSARDLIKKQKTDVSGLSEQVSDGLSRSIFSLKKLSKLREILLKSLIVKPEAFEHKKNAAEKRPSRSIEPDRWYSPGSR